MYEPEKVRLRYDRLAQEEWERLDSTPHGKLTYLAHRSVLEDHVSSEDRLLELGAGSGRFTKDLSLMCSHLTVTDLSPKQLQFNRKKLRELGVSSSHLVWQEADICELHAFEDCGFDCVVCIGGALSYVFEKEDQALSEMIRVLKPGGKLLLGVMCLPGTVSYFFKPGVDEMLDNGIEATRWILETGKQDGKHYRPVTEHYCHMMASRDLDALCEGKPVEILERRCGGFLANSDEEGLEKAFEHPELWEEIVAAELRFCKSPALAEAGTHMIVVICKK